jgi:hypothetical protein
VGNRSDARYGCAPINNLPAAAATEIAPPQHGCDRAKTLVSPSKTQLLCGAPVQSQVGKGENHERHNEVTHERLLLRSIVISANPQVASLCNFLIDEDGQSETPQLSPTD